MPSPESAWSGRGLRRSPFCLVAALCWASVPVLWPRAGASVDILSYLALCGAGLFTLLLVALSFDDARRTESSEVRGALTLGLGLACVPWALLAQGLASATHHRPLGAATYAVFAFGSGVLAVWVSERVRSLASQSDRGRLLLRATELVALLGVAALVFVAARALLGGGMPGRVPLEIVTGMVLAVLTLVLPVSARLVAAARWAAPACLLLCAGSFGLLWSEAHVRATVKSAPVIAGAFGLALR